MDGDDPEPDALNTQQLGSRESVVAMLQFDQLAVASNTKSDPTGVVQLIAVFADAGDQTNDVLKVRSHLLLAGEGAVATKLWQARLIIVPQLAQCRLEAG